MEQISAAQLKARLDDGQRPVLLDVREPWEYQICALPDSVHIPMAQIPGRLGELNKDAEIVVVCHHGTRSQYVANFLQHQGFTRLYNLQGGVAAWARQVDPSMPQY
jgi:rhodanese-related sulfurtransferase